MIKNTFLALGLFSLLTPLSLHAGEPQKTVVEEKKEDDEPVRLNVIDLDTSYVFPSRVAFTNDKIGSGDALHNSFEYTRRIHLQGNWYFQLGLSYDRYDFGGSATKILPTKLQSVEIPIGVSYIFDGYVGFLAQVRPGLNFESRMSQGAFDIPVQMGSFIPIVDEKFYITWGFGTSILQKWPVMPMIGVVWVINDQFRIMGYAPEPKIIYQPNERWQFWAGGEFASNAYKVDKRADKKLSGTVVVYSEYRVGGGVTWEPIDNWELNLVGGYAVHREFDFERANKSYSADPAPYIRFALSAEF